MADIHTRERRSFNMSQIRSKDTKPELRVRKFLHANGFRYRLHDKRLPGKPDIVLPKYKTVIEVKGCFWHGHQNCKLYRIPQTNTDWWLSKINNNIKRDNTNSLALYELGWRILVVWECELKNKGSVQKLESLKQTLIDGKVHLSVNTINIIDN